MFYYFQPPIFAVAAQPALLISPQPRHAYTMQSMSLLAPPPATTLIQAPQAPVPPRGGGVGRVLGEVDDEQPQQQPLPLLPEALPLQRLPISMRVVLLVEDGSCIVQDVRYGAAPETMARVLADVGYVLSQHGFDDEVGGMSRGVLRVTSGREPPGVQVVSGGGRRVVLLSPVVWERRAAAVEEGNEELGEALGEAANRGDWMVFVLSEEEGAGGRGDDVEGGNATQDGNAEQGGNDGQDSNAGRDANDGQDSNAGQDPNDGQGDHVSSSPRLDNPPPGSGANSPPASHGSSRGSSTPPPPPPSPPAPSVIVS
ncbi:hypothetical protein BBAD15_g5656 [Beauveria bassiana D1-5]|uniref:Uncharacterized protein n=1 Tax=Beauveria bassiana D1-5 TaxID=1245745 RepID=A0A0A2VM75_BEABA|nr:hypothetical protein BBAD15_g5656 [Beauveria bassiana D1-5]